MIIGLDALSVVTAGARGGGALPGGFDFYVDQANGSDADDGSSAAPFATLRQLRSVIQSTIQNDGPDGIALTAYVAGGAIWSDYMHPGATQGAGSNDGFSINLTPAAPTLVAVTFGDGTVFDGKRTERLADPATHGTFDGGASAIGVYGGANLTLRVRAEHEVSPIVIRNWGGDGGNGNAQNGADGSEQALNMSGAARLEAFDVAASDCGEIVSAHNSSTGLFVRLTGRNGLKTLIANVQTSTCEFIDCHFTQDQGAAVPGFAGATYGPFNNSDAGDTYTRCTFTAGPNATQVPWLTPASGDVYTDCTVGTPTGVMRILADQDGATFNDCYVHLFTETGRDINLNGCFGKLSVRWRPDEGSAGIKVANGVFVAPTADKRSFFYSDFSPNGSVPVAFTDNVFVGATERIAFGNGFQSFFDPDKAGDFVASGAVVAGNAFFANTQGDIVVDFVNASAAAADPKPVRANHGVDLSAQDPQLAGLIAHGGTFATLADLAAGSTDRADYALTTPALASGGVNNGQVGFTV